MTESPTPARQRWSLSRDALLKLLDRLDSDPQRAGEHYEQIHRKLVRLFEYRGASDPEELADETIVRVTRKVDQGMEIRAKDPYRYFCGVAHRVLKEVLREREKELSALRQVSHTSPPWTVPEVEVNTGEIDRRPCMRSCLRHLSKINRRLVLEYHRSDGSSRIRHRRQLAAELGIPVSALRLRAYRIRSRLETCVTECLRCETESDNLTPQRKRTETKPDSWKRK